MIERYTRPEMGSLWEASNRFEQMLRVEKAVAQVQVEFGLIPSEAAQAINEKASFSVERIQEIEATTKHDVIAFVTAVAETVGPLGRYIHYGLTSSDVLDSALSLQIQQAGKLLLKSVDQLEEALLKQVEDESLTLCAGRTHGMHAEPTSFGLKMAGFVAELRRNRQRLETAIERCRVVKLSGAVGTYSALSPEIELKVGERLGLRPETIATQVIPRDRHAEMILALSFIGSGLERLSVELRHLQRTEVGEVVEGFSQGQKGSSAMPHKKNPISAENLTGCARLLRSYGQTALENVALWHERDISHSSVERVIFPDAFILCHYAVERMTTLVKSLKVEAGRMQKNMDLSQGQLFSSHVLLALVEKGLSREQAYALVQKNSHNLQSGQSLADSLKEDDEVQKLLNSRELDQIFSGKRHQRSIGQTIKNVLSNKNRTEEGGIL